MSGGGWFKYGGQGYKSDLIPSLAGSRQPSSVDAKISDDSFADVDNDDNTDNKSSKKHPNHPSPNHEAWPLIPRSNCCKKPKTLHYSTAPTLNGDLKYFEWRPNFEWNGDPRQQKWGPKKRIVDKLTETRFFILVESRSWRDRNLKFGPNYDLEVDNLEILRFWTFYFNNR